MKVRNVGDVPMTVEVTNDTAPDCDFTLDGEGLRAGAASGVTCTVTTPAEEGAEEMTNTAAYSADPLESTGDTGEPLTGADDATVTLVAGQAPPPETPGADPSPTRSPATASAAAHWATTTPRVAGAAVATVPATAATSRGRARHWHCPSASA